MYVLQMSTDISRSLVYKLYYAILYGKSNTKSSILVRQKSTYNI